MTTKPRLDYYALQDKLVNIQYINRKQLPVLFNFEGLNVNLQFLSMEGDIRSAILSSYLYELCRIPEEYSGNDSNDMSGNLILLGSYRIHWGKHDVIP